MDSPYSPLEYALLNAWQRDFPIVAQPFAEVARKVGAGETAGLAVSALAVVRWWCTGRKITAVIHKRQQLG